MSSGMKYASKAYDKYDIIIRARSYRYLSLQFRINIPTTGWNLANSRHFSGAVYFQCRCHVLQGLMGTIRATFQAGLHPEERESAEPEPSRAEDQPCIAISLCDVSQIYKCLSRGTSSEES